MGKIELVILIIVGLFTLFGLFRGFVKQLMSAAGWLVSLVGAFLLTEKVSILVKGSSIGDQVVAKVTAWIADFPTFNIPFDQANATEQLSSAISELGLPKFIADAIAKGVDFSSVPTTFSLAEVLSPSISSVIITIITFIGLFVVIFILFKILGHFLNKLFSGKVLGFVNKILGAVLGLTKAVLIVSVLMLVLSTAAGMIPAVNDFVTADLASNGGLGIAKYLYESNPLVALIEGSFSFDNLF
ncbi:MAG: CvpA family protein [Bacilli bacterium]